MKKLLFFLIFLFPLGVNAAPVKYVQISTAPSPVLQPGTTTGFYVSSGTALNFNASTMTVSRLLTVSSMSVTGQAAFGQQVNISSDIYTADYTSYGAISTITGWTSFTSQLIDYKKIGKLVYVWWDLRGTSNSTLVTFTLPFTSKNTVSFRVCSDTTDNGTETTTGGLAVLPGNSATIQIYKDMAQTVWTNSGTKNAIGMIVFQTNQ